MYKDRNASIKDRQQENKRLQQQTKKMEQELQRIKKIKNMEIQRMIMQKQLQQLDIQEKKEKEKIEANQNLRNYGNEVMKKNQEKMKKKLKKFNLADVLPESDPEQELTKNDTGNLEYFLNLMGMNQYLDRLVEYKIFTLPQLKELKETDVKKIGIPIKDMVKINKKLRTMGI